MTALDATPTLTHEEQRHLLTLACDAIAAAANGQPLPQPDLNSLSPALSQLGACFVTINQAGTLRGCTGTLIATRQLALEVVRSAAQTATGDPRFDPIRPDELDTLEIEISVLSSPRKLHFDDPALLPELIRPGVDGVTLYHGAQRATFLPQVWERIPDPQRFLEMLCRKMGLPSTAWTEPGITAEVYQVTHFSEDNPA
jgi:AmmeMemoRadiSam system protein A